MFKRIIPFLLFFFVVSFFDVEAKTELYTDLDEKTANKILFVLLKNKIDAEKSSEGKKFKIYVDETKIARSLRLLESEGLPGKTFENISELLKNDGLVSSPLQEKARYVYAISQMLEETILNIDGIIAARIHIVLPTENTIGEIIYPSSAAVFIKYRDDHTITALVPKLKKLVADSVEGLDYSRVGIVLFETASPSIDNIPLQSSSNFWYWIIGAISIIILLAIVVFLVYYFYFRERRATPVVEEDSEDGDAFRVAEKQQKDDKKENSGKISNKNSEDSDEELNEDSDEETSNKYSSEDDVDDSEISEDQEYNTDDSDYDEEK